MQIMPKTTTDSRNDKAGLPPGALIHIGKKFAEQAKVSVIDYTNEQFIKTDLANAAETKNYLSPDTVSWINVDGLHDIKLIAQLGEIYDLHPLLLEDVLNTKHRPKVEEFEDYIFLTLKMLSIDENREIVNEQVSFVLGKSWVISFQEQEGDIFDSMRVRLENKKGNARAKGPDYLLYRLIDTIVDGYFLITDHIAEEMETLENVIINNPNENSIARIQELKKDLIKLRRAISPLREAVTTIQNSSSALIQPETYRYLGDVHEHLIQVTENIDNARDMLIDLREVYQSGQNNRLNEVMKVLTIMSSIFIPMTFIAGVYGMNFQNMPELQWQNGYFGALGIMVLIPIVMLIYFKRKGWL